LSPVVKEQYLGFVDGEYPDLVPRYERAYVGSNAPTEYQQALDVRIARIREQFGFVSDSMRTGEVTPPADIAGSSAEPAFRRVGPQLQLPMAY
jgi:hypothetical protein